MFFKILKIWILFFVVGKPRIEEWTQEETSSSLLDSDAILGAKLCIQIVCVKHFLLHV